MHFVYFIGVYLILYVRWCRHVVRESKRNPGKHNRAGYGGDEMCTRKDEKMMRIKSKEMNGTDEAWEAPEYRSR